MAMQDILLLPMQSYNTKCKHGGACLRYVNPTNARDNFIQAILIKILVQVGSNLLINLLRSGADELQKRKDNDFSNADTIKTALDGVVINGRNKQ